MINITKSQNAARELNPNIFSTPVQNKELDYRKCSFHKSSLHIIDPSFNGSKSFNDQQTISKNYINQNSLQHFQKLVTKVLKNSTQIDTQRSLSQNSKMIHSQDEKFFSQKNYATVAKDSSPKKTLKSTILLFSQINSLLCRKNKSPQLPIRQSVRVSNQQDALLLQIQKRNSIVLKDDDTYKRRNTTQNGRRSMKEYSLKNFYALLATQNKKHDTQDSNSFTASIANKLNNSQQQSNYFSQPSQNNSISKFNSTFKQNFTIQKQFTLNNDVMLNELFNRVKNKLAMHDYEKLQWKQEREQLLIKIKKLEDDLGSKQQILEQSFG